MAGRLVGGAAVTVTVTVSATPLGAAAMMSAAPSATPVARPEALTVAIKVAVLVQTMVAREIGWLAASAAVAANSCEAPTAIEAPLGAIVTLATIAGGVTGPSSLHVPKVAVIGPLQVSLASRCNDDPAGEVLDSLTPRSMDVRPLAGPPTPAKVPPYDRNSTRTPLLSTSAMASGSPF